MKKAGLREGGGGGAVAAKKGGEGRDRGVVMNECGGEDTCIGTTGAGANNEAVEKIGGNAGPPKVVGGVTVKGGVVGETCSLKYNDIWRLKVEFRGPLSCCTASLFMPTLTHRCNRQARH